MNRRTFFKAMAWALAQIGMSKIAGPMSEPWFAGCDIARDSDCTVISIWVSDGAVFRSIDNGTTWVEQAEETIGIIWPTAEYDRWASAL